MAIYKVSGYEGTTVALEELIDTLKLQEGVDNLLIRELSIRPTSNCHVILNGCSPIAIKATNGFSVDEVGINSIVFTTEVYIEIAFKY